MDAPEERLMRINKALAAAGVCSRRHADALVAAGRVTVNGEVVREAGLRIDPACDALAVDGAPVALAGDTPVVVMLHKKPGTVTTASDPEGRPTVYDALPEPWRSRRLFPVGRLDAFSEGLLILTDDGELANRLTHPRYHLPKVYHVRVRGDVAEDKLNVMRQGMTLAEGETLAPVRVSMLAREGETTLLSLTLRQGINRQIRRMCRDLGLTVLRLRRVGLGPLKLGSLPVGAARELTAQEAAALLAAAGLTGPAA